VPGKLFGVFDNDAAVVHGLFVVFGIIVFSWRGVYGWNTLVFD
jgi:hypothetical protein